MTDSRDAVLIPKCPENDRRHLCHSAVATYLGHGPQLALPWSRLFNPAEGKKMFKSAVGILSALVLVSMTLGAANAQNPVVDALKGCSKEIETYCSTVTPG